MLGQCYEQFGDEARAIDEYRRAVELNPLSNKTAALLASILLRAGDVAKARKVALSILARSPTYGPAKRLI